MHPQPTPPLLTPNVIRRFWALVDRTTTPDGCWLWSATPSQPTPRIQIERRQFSVSRISYQIAFGPIPAGLIVCHRCDTPRCVNPAHLFLGTYQDNMDDAVRKGRRAYGPRNGAYTHPERVIRGAMHYARRHPESRYGERNPAVKLTAGDVVDIRTRHAAGAATRRALAQEYGVSKSLIDRIVTRNVWKHV